MVRRSDPRRGLKSTSMVHTLYTSIGMVSNLDKVDTTVSTNYRETHDPQHVLSRLPTTPFQFSCRPANYHMVLRTGTKSSWFLLFLPPSAMLYQRIPDIHPHGFTYLLHIPFHAPPYVKAFVIFVPKLEWREFLVLKWFKLRAIINTVVPASLSASDLHAF